jgi:3-hydroxyisobutyrate dehydrogenase-like beta-hydroxyacid dehydrogenase
MKSYERGAETLRSLAGTLTHVGTDVGAASALDFAILSYFFSGLMGFCARSPDLITRHAEEAGLDRQVPQAVAALFERGRAAGLGQEGPAALVKVLRGSAVPAVQR